jgi:hypothetical protein
MLAAIEKQLMRINFDAPGKLRKGVSAGNGPLLRSEEQLS